MSLYNLDFSGWRQGNAAYAEGLLKSETERAEGEAARMRGLESGIGTVAGAIIGGIFGGPMGAVKGAQMGGSLMSGGQMTGAQAASLAGGLMGGSSTATPYGGAVDPGQVASANNMVGGLVDMSAAKTGNMYGQWDPTAFTR